MRKLHWIAVSLIIALSSCSTNYYAFDGDYNGKKFDGEFSEDEILIKKEMFNDIIHVEDFNSQQLSKGMSGYIRPDIIDGELKSVSPKDGVGNTLNYENPDGFHFRSLDSLLGQLGTLSVEHKDTYRFEPPPSPAAAA